LLLEIFDIEPLKRFFDLIYDSANMVELKLDQEKMSISLLNNSHVAFYNLILKKDFFGEYTVDGAEVVSVYVEDFYKILKSSHKSDTLVLKSDDAYLSCVFEHEGNRRVFELPLAEDFGGSPNPPSIDYPAEFEIRLVDLKQPVDDLDKIVKTDKFKMTLIQDELNVVAPTDAMTKYSNTILVETDNADTSSSTFNIDYISSLQKLSKISENVLIKIGNQLPCTWIIVSPDDLVEISGLIAPIIEEEE